MVICSYDEWEIYLENGRSYLKEYDTNTVKEVTPIFALPYELAKVMSEEELFEADFEYDVSGELDTDRSYCYWKYR